MLETLTIKNMMKQGRVKHLHPLLDEINPYKKHFYIESYGCAMNFADSEVVASILQDNGFGATNKC